MFNKEYIEFDCSPLNEDCVSVSQSEDYMSKMREEATKMLTLLRNKFQTFPGYFRIKTQSHDFGQYLEIRYYYDDNEEGQESANTIESHYPQTWTDVDEITWQEKTPVIV